MLNNQYTVSAYKHFRTNGLSPRESLRLAKCVSSNAGVNGQYYSLCLYSACVCIGLPYAFESLLQSI